MELFAFEIDFTRRIEGQNHWSAERIVQTMLRRRPHRLRDAKYARPMDVDVALVVDVSGSCEPQANMFMAIAAGCIGPNVKVYVSFNGVIIPQALRPPTHRPNDYTDATAWVQQAFDEVQASSDFNLEFSEFVSQEQPKTVIILGDHDGIDLYRTAVADPRNRSRKFFWIANVVDSNPPEFIPEGFNAKNYIADVMEPKDFIRAVKKLRAI
ncbi:MAG: hypothetical protein HKM24_04885 [Gammaproteobacteria bacterium]|nr:hypothetical protein [Gammaproteobacteria bacterium]